MALARTQCSAVLRMRWRMLVNSLRTRQGKFELGARIFATVFFCTVWLLAGIGCAVLAHQIAADRQLIFLPALLWPLLLMWQVVPVMLSTAQESVELNFLLRFPVSFRTYTLLYLFFGLFDPSSLLGGLCLLGIWSGVVVARPGLALWTFIALALFAVFNFLLTRTIFAWIERWLAKRRTREVLGIASLFVFLAFQLLNPALHSHTGHVPAMNRTTLLHLLKVVQSIQIFFPPGLAGDAVAFADQGRDAAGAGLLGAVALYSAAAGVLLAIRLRAEFRGESFGDAPAASVKRGALPRSRPIQGTAEGTQVRWRFLDGPVSAILGKELQYLMRSGVMLFGLFAPLILIFAMGGPIRTDQSFSHHYLFPIAIAYGFLPLTRQICNSLGAEGAGIQLYFLAPMPFRKVMLAKNLLQTALFGIEVSLVATIAISRFGLPGRSLAVATICWVLFALPTNLAAGNILSITLAYRMTLTRLSREQGSVGNGLLSLLVQVLIFAVGAAIYIPLANHDHAELAAPVLLLLAAGGWLFWLRVLGNVDAMASSRRETLIEALVRAA